MRAAEIDFDIICMDFRAFICFILSGPTRLLRFVGVFYLYVAYQ
jgi:hypothetical protein